MILGRNYVFRFNHPEQAAKERLENMVKSASSDVMSEFFNWLFSGVKSVIGYLHGSRVMIGYFP